jgi:predicted RNase H-like nuclease (RuvC/YqgF family)
VPTSSLFRWPLQRTKKRRWKAAYAAATGEVEALHKQLLAKQKELEGLEGRLKRLERELRLLAAGAGAGGGVRLPAAALAGKGEVICIACVLDTV